MKRKREELASTGDSVHKPPPGTRSFTTGKAVKQALALGNRQSFVSFHQQILTASSLLPLPIAHSTIVILQHYLDASPSLDEIFECWSYADKSRNDKLLESAVALLIHIIVLLTPLPFFRPSLVGIVRKIQDDKAGYHIMLNKLVQSGKREQILLGLHLAATVVQFDRPDPAAASHGASGRLAIRMWGVLVEGGSVKGLGKLMGMRRRGRDGAADYGDKDPLDKPDVRHALLQIILPLLTSPAFQVHARQILPGVYSNLSTDPPITVLRVLNALWMAMTAPTPGVARRISLTLLDERALESLLGLLAREDIETSTGRAVGDIVGAFLEGATCSPGRGLCFQDEGWYLRDSGTAENTSPHERERRGLHNRILANVVKKIGAKVADETRLGEWAIKLFQACPELLAGYWAHSALSLEPRLATRWTATMSYIGRIISLPRPPHSTFRQPIPRGANISAEDMPPRSEPPSVATMIEAILPSPFTKAHITKGLSHPDLLVQHMTAVTLARGLQKLGVVQDALLRIERELEVEPGPSSSVWVRRRRELEIEARRRVPEVLVIIGFAQRSATLARTLPDSDDEPDPAVLARSQMLTESALRLFGLYHQNLPSIANEARFDVGKLLVSASSARAERRERREAREGSVISDSGSVGSIGTVGTAGMGGGFGHARGEVHGFEALAQVHVLRLLGAVRDWQWSSKAAGSQYTYLYHILLLHLNTPYPKTREMTIGLLDRLLQPSILFEHDPDELAIWLSALPRLENGNLESRARLLMQQIHLLSFLDDCVRRCFKTPYRYIEDSMALVPEYFSTTKVWEMISPTIMTVLEQLRAKILGELIATEAAGVVLRYLGRVLLGLAGKMKDGKFMEAVLAKIEEILLEAKVKGQSRAGLSAVVDDIKGCVRTVFNNRIEYIIDLEHEHALADEAEWAERNFEPRLLTLLGSSDTDQAATQLEKRFLDAGSSSAIARYGHLVLHLLSSRQDGSLSILLHILHKCLNLAAGASGQRLKDAVFSSAPIVLLLTSRGGDEYRPVLKEIVGTLRDNDGEDRSLSEGYIRRILHLMEKPRIDLTLQWFLPWIRFIEPEQATEAISKIVPRIKELVDVPREVIDATVGQLVLQTGDAAFALSHLKPLIKLDIIDSVTRLLDSQVSQRDHAIALRELDVPEKTMKKLLENRGLASTGLLTKLVSISSKATRAFVANIKNAPELAERSDLVPTAAVLTDLPGILESDVEEKFVQTAVSSLAEDANAAIRVLVGLAGRNPEAVNNAISVIPLSSFGPAQARLAESIGTVEHTGLGKGQSHLFELALQWAVRICSSDAALSESAMETLDTLTRALRLSTSVELKGHLVEPVITAVILDRLGVPAAVDFAIVLSEKATVKASFVRQTVQQLFDSNQYKSLSVPSSSARPDRAAFIHLISNVFLGSPYASCQPNFIEPLLPLYEATLSPADQRLLALFKLFETNRHVSAASILKAWSPNGVNRGQRAFDCLISLDARQVFATCARFPLRRKLGGEIQEQESGEQLYDPAFVLMLFTMTLSEPLTGLDWVEVLRTNALSLAVCALASRDAGMRGLGAYCLAKSLALVAATPFQERPTVLHILRLIRHAIPAPVEAFKVPRLPTLTTLFLAHAFRSISTPGHFLYPLIARFLLQRPTLDLYDVPMLYSMLYSSEEGYKRERAWIVRLLGDGVRSEADWRILKRRQTWSLIATIFGSTRDQSYRRLNLQAMESMTRIPGACSSLVHRDTILGWLMLKWDQSTARPLPGSDEELRLYLKMVENIVVNMVHLDKGFVERRRWDEEVGFLVRRAVVEADSERLIVLSRIIFRLSQLEKCNIPKDLFPLIVSRLKELDSTGKDGDKERKELDQVVENLFGASLGLQGRFRPELRDAVDEVGWRAGLLDSDVGRWVRKETRSAEWASLE